MEFYNSAVKMFIRPPRAEYTLPELGPTRLTIGERQFVREDLTLTNGRNMKLQCSHFLPAPEQRNQKLPCLVYLHGNCGCRVDSLELIHLVLGHNISLFTFDFSGSGQSEGQYISLGFYEKDDTAVVFEHLRKHPLVSNIGLWGMSMGAATSLWFSSLHPDWVTCIIADSPFAKLTQVAQEIVHQQEMKAPKWLVSGTVSVGLKMVRKSIKKKAKFDLRHNKPIAYVHTCKAPVLFGHADTDRVIPAKHSAQLFEKYPNLHKRFIQFPGDHNTPRPVKFYEAASRFLWEYLLEPAHRQAVTAPIKPLANTPPTQRNENVWLVRRLPVNPEDAVNIQPAEALCLLVVDNHGIKTFTPFTEQLILSQKWYSIAVYWSVTTHFCVDFKYADGRHGRWIFSTLESDAIMNATKRQVAELKPRSKKKLLLKGPTAEGLENVGKGVTAFSPKTQLQLEVHPSPEAHTPAAVASSPPPQLVNESQIFLPSIRNAANERRIEKVGILPRPDDEELDISTHLRAPVAALPWEAFATQPAPARPLTSASSPNLTRAKPSTGAPDGIKKETSLERRNTQLPASSMAAAPVNPETKGTDTNDTKDANVGKDAKDATDATDAKDAKGIKDTKDGKDVKDAKDAKGAKDAKKRPSRRSREPPTKSREGVKGREGDKRREGDKSREGDKASSASSSAVAPLKEKERLSGSKDPRKPRPSGAREATDRDSMTAHERRRHSKSDRTHESLRP